MVIVERQGVEEATAISVSFLLLLLCIVLLLIVAVVLASDCQ